MSNSTHRSTQAQGYRKLYKSARWLRTRDLQLRTQPLCQACRRKGFVVTATVCHHTRPETKLDPATFFDGPFMSLCTQCHDAEYQQVERIGFSTSIGNDGWPTDHNHPVHRDRTI